MAATNMAYTPAITAPTGGPASFVPDQDDFDQMHRIKAIHDVLDLCPELPLDVRLGLLDHAWTLLGGNGQPASSPREAVHA